MTDDFWCGRFFGKMDFPTDDFTSLELECPCGVIVSYPPWASFPYETKKHPCNAPNHWTAYYD